MDMQDAPKMTKQEKADREKWQAEDDIRTLLQAAEVRKDGPRFKRAMKQARAQLKALKEVDNA